MQLQMAAAALRNGTTASLPAPDGSSTVQAVLATRSNHTAGSFAVVEVNASEFDPTAYDAVFDVRNMDEFTSMPGAEPCSIGRRDAEGCSYGHLPEALWAPQFLHCGRLSASSAPCTEWSQWLTNVELLTAMNITDLVPPAFLAMHNAHYLHIARPHLEVCRVLRFAFICHSGGRSKKAAGTFAGLMSELFPHAHEGESPVEVVSVLGGVHSWFHLGRPTTSGPPAGLRLPTCAELAAPPLN